MIVFCEDCGERNVIDPEAIRKSGEPVRCTSCGDVLRLSIPIAMSDKPAAPAGAAEEAQPAVMDLRMGDYLIEINQTRPTVTMGRQEHNDLEVIDTRVSRSHARIEYRDGKFILIDHSTNGTFVVMNGKPQGINLRREEITLKGSGIITLGRKASQDSPKAIHFTLKP